MWGEIVTPCSSSSTRKSPPTASTSCTSRTPSASASTRRSSTPLRSDCSSIERIVHCLQEADAFARLHQRDSRNLDSLTSALDLYHARPEHFLKNFGMCMANVCDPRDVRHAFPPSLCRDNEAVNKQMMHVEAAMNARDLSEKRVKNRRLAAMNRLVDEDHFSAKAMREREPWLHENVVGSKQSEQEQRSILRDDCSLSTMITDHLDLVRQRERRDAQRLADNNNDEEEEEDNDDNETKLSREEEFLRLMKERFVDGLDSTVDYDKIDHDENLDDAEQIERDAQDKYFDED